MNRTQPAASNPYYEQMLCLIEGENVLTAGTPAAEIRSMITGVCVPEEQGFLPKLRANDDQRGTQPMIDGATDIRYRILRISAGMRRDEGFVAQDGH